MNQNERLTAELAAAQKSSSAQRRTSIPTRNGRRDGHVRRNDQGMLTTDMKRELALSRERELSYEAALTEKEQREAELHRRIEESKEREAYLENELANMYITVAKLKKSQGTETDASEATRDSQGIDGFDIWNSPAKRTGF